MIKDVKRTAADAALTREAVLDAARRVFERKGFASSTLNDIAREAKVTRGAVYHHFKDKAELYQTLLLESGRRSQEQIAPAIGEGGSVLAILARVFARQLRGIDEDANLRAQALFALRGDYHSIPAVREHIVQTRAHSIGQLTRAIAEGQAGGQIRDDLAPRDLARAFVALQNGLLHVSSLPGEADAIRESSDALASVLLRGLAPAR
jgi:TetR/AcrR family transcriptional regulator, acrAB operon repressor